MGLSKLSSVEDFPKVAVILECCIVPPISALCPLCLRVIYSCFRQDCRISADDVVAAVVRHSDVYGCRPWKVFWNVNVKINESTPDQ
jgi:hypothetical protein